MFPAEPLSICSTCTVPHYTNCPDCYGFGVCDTELNGMLPVRSSRALTDPALGGARACPTCGSTTAGMPEGPTIAFGTDRMVIQ